MLVLLYGFFRGFQRFEVFFEHVVHFDCIRQKRECSHNADEVRFFGRTKTNYIILNFVYTRRFVRDRSFLEVLILDRARPVWSGCEVTCFCYIAGTDDRIYSVHEHDFASHWLWDLNRGSLIIIASRTEFVQEFVYDGISIPQNRQFCQILVINIPKYI